MNRIETKIIIMVTNRLASAKDSDSKTEMIEELSENLYQRYLELTEQGTPEDEALAKAMESLGDVEELLAFLREAEGEGASSSEKDGRARTEETKAEDVQEGRSQEKDTESEGARTDDASQDWSFEFKKDLESGIDAIVNIALDTAKAATKTAKATASYARDMAKDVARDVSEQWKEHCPDGVFYMDEEMAGQKTECTAVAVTDAIHSLDIRLVNGDVSLCVVDKDDTYIEVNGDTQEVQTVLRDDGVLSIVQENTASASFLFLRGVRRCNIFVTLPRKVWNRVSISTVNGDVLVKPELECQVLDISTASGDVRADFVRSDNVTCHSGSGDIDVRDLAGNLYAATKSGDVRVKARLGRCELHSISGDVEFLGGSDMVKCTSTSGDVKVDLENVPQEVEATSVSGDCEVRIPNGAGMHISYRTISGDFSTNLPLTVNMTKKRGETTLGDGMGARVKVSSTSGDVGIFTKVR